MNFRTTLILLIVLVAVGLVLLFTRDVSTKPETVEEKKLLTIAPSDVTKITFISLESVEPSKTSLEKTDGKWHLTEPVKAAAEDSTVSSLLDSVTGLKSRGQVETAGSNAKVTGLDAPRFKVELTTKDGKTTRIDVGSRSATGGNVYIKREGQSQADVVAAAISDQLEKPLKDWRSTRLFTVSSPQVMQMRVATTQGSVALEKFGDDWKVSQPTSMPADPSAASDWANAVTSLRADEFVDAKNTPEQMRRYGLDQPTMSVAFSTTAPSTQPGTTQPSFTTVQFGRYGEVEKKTVYASISSEPGMIVKVSATSLDQFKKKPIELRDKRVLNIDPQTVTKISIAIDKPATTQPTTQEAVQKTVVLERNKQMNAMPATVPAVQEALAATTGPSTGPTSSPTTLAATKPAEPPSKWKLTSKDDADADDSKVESLLSELHPLKADKFIESVPMVQIVPTYSLRIETTDAVHEIRFSDPGNSKPITATYNGLNFEMPRFFLERVDTDFTKSATSSAPPMNLMMPGGMPFNMP